MKWPKNYKTENHEYTGEPFAACRFFFTFTPKPNPMQALKSILPGCFIVLSVYVFANEQSGKFYNETYRSQFHFSAPENQMGSPIALFRSDSLYHMLFQYNPYNLFDGFFNWGQAVSSDLVNWRYTGLVLTQPDSTTHPMTAVPWWGSIVRKNGQLTGYFNRHRLGLYSGELTPDSGIHQEVLLSGQDEFLNCDPFVFWHQASGRWILMTYDRPDSVLNFYNSKDGLSWEPTGSIPHNFGFPTLYELPVDRKPDETRWVLFGEEATYQIGQFDGKRFIPESETRRFDLNTGLGGTICIADSSENPRLIMVSELKSVNHPDLPSNGQLTFPAEVILHQSGSSIELFHTPISEISHLYGKPYKVSKKKIYPGINNNVLAGTKGTCFHFKLVVDLLNSDYFGMMIRSNKTRNGTELGYNVARKLFSLAGRQLDYSAPNGKLNLEILVDRSSIEVFIDGGQQVLSIPITPEPSSLRYEIFTNGGEILIENLEVYPVSSIWPK